ncbi:hypothetical protein GGD83_001676 [Rhodoblastus sphagnicola]|nr:hypothetical protein [Rhodoblastus sphagnicola]
MKKGRITAVLFPLAECLPRHAMNERSSAV